MNFTRNKRIREISKKKLGSKTKLIKKTVAKIDTGKIALLSQENPKLKILRQIIR